MNNIIIVRITKSSDPENWYAKHIGEEFSVWDSLNRHGEYEVYGQVMGLLIHMDDCEKV